MVSANRLDTQNSAGNTFISAHSLTITQSDKDTTLVQSTEEEYTVRIETAEHSLRKEGDLDLQRVAAANPPAMTLQQHEDIIEQFNSAIPTDGDESRKKIPVTCRHW